MPAIDQCHEQVVNALAKAGWDVANKQFGFKTPLNWLFIDIQATRVTNGDIEQILLVEVKCFADGSSTMPDLYTAIGQYIVYRTMLRELGKSVPLYLAIPTKAYYGVFQRLVPSLIDELKINVIVVDLSQERIELWRP